MKQEIEKIISKAILDFDNKWRSHEEKKEGISKYADEILSLPSPQPYLPSDSEVTEWWNENGIKDASSGSAVFKFRQWLRDRSKLPVCEDSALKNTKQYFHIVKERVVKDVIAFDRNEFLSEFLKNRPTEIWCDQWSSKKPLYVITEYKENTIFCYCNSAADKTPTEQDQDYIYFQLRYAGLSQSYFFKQENNITPKTNK